MSLIKVKNFFIGKKQPLTLISGPCVIEGEKEAFLAAKFLKNLCLSLGINFVYKSSYDKANRSSYDSFRGPGLHEGLRILKKIRDELDVPILSDIHTVEEAIAVGEVCDIIQVPALLSRQTDLILAAGNTGAIVNLKKGQFMAPWDMSHVINKLLTTGNHQILITDRGTCFGYNNLISDLRAIPILQSSGFPVCFDASHSVQLPGSLGNCSGGEKKFIPVLAKAAVAAGCDCLYLESHPHPEMALSDKDSSYPFDQLEALLREVNQIYHIVSCSERPFS